MVRRLVLVAVLALAAVPAAFAAYPAPFAVQGGAGLLSSDGSTRFVAAASGTGTVVSAIRASDRTTMLTRTLKGQFGIPAVTQSGLAGGLFHDGSALVLQNMGIARTSRFLVVGTEDLAVRDAIALKGTFGFDALSPDGSRLYLIQHLSTEDVQHYVVRAYDLEEHALLPGRIADKAQTGWVMRGWPVGRTTTGDGRWVYTLYTNPGGYPFVHALDTIRGVAHCIGLPWRASQDPLWRFTLAVEGNRLAVKRADGKTWRLVDRTSFRVSSP